MTSRHFHLEQITLLRYSPIGLDLKPVKQALKGPLRPSTSGYLGDENDARGVQL